MGVKIPAAKDLEPLSPENAILWEEGSDETGFVYSGTEEFKSGKGEFLALGQGDDLTASNANTTFLSTPTDSGTSLSAEFEGKGAIIGTSATKTSQDAFAAAGTDLKTILNSNGGSDFLQLAAGASKRKISFGSATMEWGGGSPFAADAVIEHGLKAKPLLILAISTTWPQILSSPPSSFTETKATLKMYTADGGSPAKGSKETVNWIALG